MRLSVPIKSCWREFLQQLGMQDAGGEEGDEGEEEAADGGWRLMHRQSISFWGIGGRFTEKRCEDDRDHWMMVHVDSPC